ncbi:MAG: hypothetical protein RLZZ532_1510, partial [Cyanobacteriota bacterium]
MVGSKDFFDENKYEFVSQEKHSFNFEKVSAPDKHGDYYFFWKNTGLQPQAVCYVKKGMRGAEKVFIDPNELDPKGLTTYSLLDSNDDHTLMAVAVSKAGSDWSNIHIFNIEDYLLICQLLITPAELDEYLKFRERFYIKHKKLIAI